MKEIPVRVLPISKMAEQLIGSEIIKLAGEVKRKIEEGEKIYNLTIGDFDPSIFNLPSTFKNEIVNAYQEGHTNYPMANGMPELREAISSFLMERGGLDYGAAEILVSSGSRPLIYATYACLVDPSDKVIFPVPSWNNNHYSHLMRGKAVMVQTLAEDNFMPTAMALKPHLKDATLLALCSPLNPTGTVFTPENLAEICDLVLEENDRRPDDAKPLYVLYDQIYWNLTYGDVSHTDPVSLRPEMRDYTVFIDGMSKAFAATGVRVGWGYGPMPIIQKMKSILSHIGAWSPKAEQVAASRYLADLDQVDQDIDQMKVAISDRLDRFYKGFSALKQAGFPVDTIVPQGALYLTVRFDVMGKSTPDGEVLDSMKEVTAFLLEKAGVALVPFYAFGAPKDSPWFRLSVGTTKMEDVDKIVDQVGHALTMLH
ncbi:MAG: aspartate aminotransferase [Limisphaerales bacterium]|jgi:aspartate aminotransferase